MPGLLLWLLIAGATAALVFGGWPGFPWDESEEARVKGLVAILVMALLLGDLRRSGGELSGAASWPAFVAALLALAAYVNFGVFHGDRLRHDWEQFHYTLSAKYFEELGYDGLYAASVRAQLERPVVGRAVHRTSRDLRTNEVVESLSQSGLKFQEKVRGRFSEQRWQEFLSDHEVFLRDVTTDRMASMRLDHGFNAPPSWLFPARAVVGDKPLSADRLDRLGSVDLLLLLLGSAAVGWAFGTRIGCWSAALFGTSYLARFFWIGGSLLRQDWWLAVVLAACLLQKRWPLAAGCALGYAAGVRLFPLLLGVGPLLVWAARSRDAEARSEAGRFLFGLGAMLCILFGLGAVVAGDAEIWQEYAEVITLHRGTWLTNNVGLDNLLLHDRDTLGRALVDFGRDEPWTAWQERLDGNRAGRGPWSLGAKTLALLLFFFAVRRRSLAGSLVL
ncbi:MAG: hypothetical protein AAGA81_25325, partial [Acidobacteriota bacterium]